MTNERTSHRPVLQGLAMLFITSCCLSRWSSAADVVADDVYALKDMAAYGRLAITPGGVPSNRPALFYSFDEEAPGGIVNDESLNVNDGVVYGARWTNAGQYGGAYDFNGTATNYIRVPSSSTLNLTNSMTLVAWVKFKGEGAIGNHVFLMKQNGYVNSLQYALIRMASGGGDSHKYAASFSSGSSHSDYVSDYVLDDNAWYFVGATYGGTSVCLYVNGSLNKTLAKNGTISGGTNVLEMGAEHRWNEGANAVIDEVRIFSRVLSAPEMMALYSNTFDCVFSTNVLLSVDGTNVVISGSTQIKRLEPQGDIGMGTFTSGP